MIKTALYNTTDDNLGNQFSYLSKRLIDLYENIDLINDSKEYMAVMEDLQKALEAPEARDKIMEEIKTIYRQHFLLTIHKANG